MPLYTYILDFGGGTYISQVEAQSLSDASVKWAQSLDETKISAFGTKSKELLIKQVVEKTPVLINRLVNVWCLTAFLRGRLALITVVQTDKSL